CVYRRSVDVAPRAAEDADQAVRTERRRAVDAEGDRSWSRGVSVRGDVVFPDASGKEHIDEVVVRHGTDGRRRHGNRPAALPRVRPRVEALDDTEAAIAVDA